MLDKMRKWIEKNIIGIVMILYFLFTVVVGYYNFSVSLALCNSINELTRKIEIHEIQRRNDIIDLNFSLKETIKMTIFNSKNNLELLKKLITLNKIVDDNSKKYKTINELNIDKIKEANVHILNFTAGCQGSGTYIKYKNKFYILTCAHLVDYDKDEIYVKLDDSSFYPLILEKVNYDIDLALFTVDFGKDISYLEISDVNPKIGSEILVIGNPDSLIDIVTDGIICDINDKQYMFTNIIFFGNSGGAVLYKGKVIGIANQVGTYLNGFVFVNYGYAVNLDTIKEFLTYLK